MIRKYRYVLFLVLTCCVASLYSQQNEPMATISTSAKKMVTDHLQQSYLIYDYAIQKIDNQGARKQVYESYVHGEISYVDVTDPLKIMVFFEDFQQIVVLDHTLSEISTYDLFEVGYNQISVVGYSQDDRFWIYDNTNYVLKKIDQANNVYAESFIYSWQIDPELDPIAMKEKNGKVYVLDVHKGIYVFDQYGAFEKKIHLIGIRDFQIIQDKIIYYADQKLISYHTKTLETRELQLPPLKETIIHAAIQKDRLYLLTQSKLYIYAYE